MFYTIRNMTLKILTVLCPTSGLGVLVEDFAGLDTKLASIDVGVSRVATSTTSICSSPIRGGAPGCGSSANPSNRSATNRCRHLHTICCDARSGWRSASRMSLAASCSI